MRIWRILVVVLALVLAGCGQEKTYTWQHISSDVQVQADGTLDVTETLTLRYTGGPFTFAYRDLALDRMDAVRNVQVFSDGQSFQQVDDDESETPGTFSQTEDDGVLKIRWVYPPASDTTQTFTLRYTVDGAVRREGATDSVWVSVVFPERDAVVEQAEGRIRLPVPVEAQRLLASAPDAIGMVTPEPNGARVTASNLAPDNELSLRLAFPAGIVAGTVPQWQQTSDAQTQYDTTTRPFIELAAGAGALVLLLIGSGAALMWYRRHRDPQPLSVAGVVRTPPDDLMPGLAAALCNQPLGNTIAATMFDLANRGFLTLRDGEKQWGQTPVIATRQLRDGRDLSGYERQSMSMLFGDADERELSKSDLVTKQHMLTQPLADALVEHGLIDAERRAQRKPAFAVFVFAAVLGFVGFIVGAVFAERYGTLLILPGLALLLVGVAWLIGALAVQGLTPAGASARANWQAFGTALRTQSGDLPMSFGDLLPFAAAFGHAQRLVQSRKTEAPPVWFASSSPNTMDSALMAVIVSTTTSSSAGASAGSAASGGGGGGAG